MWPLRNEVVNGRPRIVTSRVLIVASNQPNLNHLEFRFIRLANNFVGRQRRRIGQRVMFLGRLDDGNVRIVNRVAYGRNDRIRAFALLQINVMRAIKRYENGNFRGHNVFYQEDLCRREGLLGVCLPLLTRDLRKVRRAMVQSVSFPSVRQSTAYHVRRRYLFPLAFSGTQGGFNGNKVFR